MFYTVIMDANTQTIYAYGTKRGALERFHSEMAYAYNQNLDRTCLVLGSDAMTYNSEICTAETDPAVEE